MNILGSIAEDNWPNPSDYVLSMALKKERKKKHRLGATLNIEMIQNRKMIRNK